MIPVTECHSRPPADPREGARAGLRCGYGCKGEASPGWGRPGEASGRPANGFDGPPASGPHPFGSRSPPSAGPTPPGPMAFGRTRLFLAESERSARQACGSRACRGQVCGGQVYWSSGVLRSCVRTPAALRSLALKSVARRPGAAKVGVTGLALRAVTAVTAGSVHARRGFTRTATERRRSPALTGEDRNGPVPVPDLGTGGDRGNPRHEPHRRPLAQRDGIRVAVPTTVPGAAGIDDRPLT